MESDILASRYDPAKMYIGTLQFLVKYHLPVYMKQAIYRLTDKTIYRLGMLSHLSPHINAPVEITRLVDVIFSHVRILVINKK